MSSTESITTHGNHHDSKLTRGVDKATAGAHHKIDAAQDAARPAVDRLVHGAHATVDTIGEMATHAAETLEVKGEQIHKAKEQVVKVSGDYLHMHPVLSIGLAVAAGYLLSRMMSPK